MDELQHWLNQYVFQSIFHAFLATCVIEFLLRIWREERPEVRLRFQLLILWIAILSFPVFQWIDPSRGDSLFRNETALFDLNAWGLLRLHGKILLREVAFIFLLAIALILFLQDLTSLLKPYSHHRLEPEPYRFGLHPKLDSVFQRFACSRADFKSAKSFALDKPGGLVARAPVFLLPSTVPQVYSMGLRKPRIYLSTELIERFDEDELETVLAHEISHISRKDHLIGWFLIFLRLLLFLNPVAVLEFRRMLQEREKLCDDEAARITEKPISLASGLIKVYRMMQHNFHPAEAGPAAVMHRLDLHSQRVRIESRVSRLVHPPAGNSIRFPEIRLCLTAIALLLLLFFVV